MDASFFWEFERLTIATKQCVTIEAMKKGQKRPGSEATNPSDLVESDPRFKSATWDPRFSRVPKRAKRAIADERFKTKLKEDPGFREERTLVDRFGRPKKGPKLHNSIRQLAADDGDISAEDSSSSEEGPETNLFINGANQLEDDDSDSGESDMEDFVDAVDEEPEHIPRGEATKRLAVIGLDWSVTRSVDILASLSCFCPTGKRIEFVEVHPSKFGLERLAVEAKLGPQVVAQEDLDVVQKAQASGTNNASKHSDILSDDDGSDEGEGDSGVESDEEEDEKQRKQQAYLREYEEQRLKYYYAVVKFEDVKSADAVYEQCDGVEYAQSGRSFDLRFIPKDMIIETSPRDRADRVPEGYAPPNVNPSSLNSSTVKLSWDADDPDRVILKKKSFGQHELDESNLKAYLASSSDEDEKEKPSEAEIERNRNLLFGTADSHDESEEGDDVDVEVTFEPGMLEKGEEIIKRKLEKEQHAEETPWEGRMRRLRERKNEKRKQRREHLAAKDDDDGSGSSDEEGDDTVEVDTNPSFSDPFFSMERSFEDAEEIKDTSTRTQKRRKDKRNKNENEDKQDNLEEDEETQRKQKAELELLLMADGKKQCGGPSSARERLAMADSDEEEEKHQRRNGKRTRGKRRSQKGAAIEVVPESAVDTNDARFQGVFDSHLFAIDPTHPKFKDNVTTKKILTEKGRRAKERSERDIAVPGEGSWRNGVVDDVKGNGSNARDELRELAARVKSRRKLKEKEAKLKMKNKRGKRV